MRHRMVVVSILMGGCLAPVQAASPPAAVMAPAPNARVPPAAAPPPTSSAFLARAAPPLASTPTLPEQTSAPPPVPPASAPTPPTVPDAAVNTPPAQKVATPRTPFVASKRERWRAALDGYVGKVTAENRRALAGAAVAFARYLNAMHARIHPIFAESFLVSLGALSADNPLNVQSLIVRLEIVLTKEGRVRSMGVVSSSGETHFDIAALDSVDRAQPFDPPPSEILSPDGNVYLHWEFHRDESHACSTQGSRPYLLQE